MLSMSLLSIPDNYSSPFTTSQSNLLMASGNTLVHADVEGFFANATCSSFAPDYRPVVSNNQDLVEFTFDFGCGTKLAIYSLAQPVVVDTYACVEGAPYLFVYSVIPASGSLTFGYRCSINATSGVVPIVLDPHVRAAKVTGPVTQTVTIPDSLGLVAFMGVFLLNNFGTSGWQALSKAFNLVESQGFDPLTFVTYATEMLAKQTLAAVGALFTFVAAANDTSILYSSGDSQVRVRPATLVPG